MAEVIAVVSAISAVGSLVSEGTQLAKTIRSVAHAIGSAGVQADKAKEDLIKTVAVLEQFGDDLQLLMEHDPNILKKRFYDEVKRCVSECRSIFTDLRRSLQSAMPGILDPGQEGVDYTVRRRDQVRWPYTGREVQALQMKLEKVRSEIKSNANMIVYTLKIRNLEEDKAKREKDDLRRRKSAKLAMQIYQSEMQTSYLKARQARIDLHEFQENNELRYPERKDTNLSMDSQSETSFNIAPSGADRRPTQRVPFRETRPPGQRPPHRQPERPMQYVEEPTNYEPYDADTYHPRTRYPETQRQTTIPGSNHYMQESLQNRAPVSSLPQPSRRQQGNDAATQTIRHPPLVNGDVHEERPRPEDPPVQSPHVALPEEPQGPHAEEILRPPQQVEPVQGISSPAVPLDPLPQPFIPAHVESVTNGDLRLSDNPVNTSKPTFSHDHSTQTDVTPRRFFSWQRSTKSFLYREPYTVTDDSHQALFLTSEVGDWHVFKHHLAADELSTIIQKFQAKAKLVWQHYDRIGHEQLSLIETTLEKIREEKGLESWSIMALEIRPKRARFEDIRSIQVVVKWEKVPKSEPEKSLRDAPANKTPSTTMNDHARVLRSWAAAPFNYIQQSRQPPPQPQPQFQPEFLPQWPQPPPPQPQPLPNQPLPQWPQPPLPQSHPLPYQPLPPRPQQSPPVQPPQPPYVTTQAPLDFQPMRAQESGVPVRTAEPVARQDVKQSRPASLTPSDAISNQGRPERRRMTTEWNLPERSDQNPLTMTREVLKKKGKKKEDIGALRTSEQPPPPGQRQSPESSLDLPDVMLGRPHPPEPVKRSKVSRKSNLQWRRNRDTRQTVVVGRAHEHAGPAGPSKMNSSVIVRRTPGSVLSQPEQQQPRSVLEEVSQRYQQFMIFERMLNESAAASATYYGVPPITRTVLYPHAGPVTYAIPPPPMHVEPNRLVQRSSKVGARPPPQSLAPSLRMQVDDLYGLSREDVPLRPQMTSKKPDDVASQYSQDDSILLSDAGDIMRRYTNIDAVSEFNRDSEEDDDAEDDEDEDEDGDDADANSEKDEPGPSGYANGDGLFV